MSNISSENIFTIGDRLKKIREELGFSQKDFAKELEVSLKTYQNYEKNKTPIPHTVFVSLQRISSLPFSTDWLINGIGSIYHSDVAIENFMKVLTNNKKHLFEEFIDRYMYYYIFTELEMNDVQTPFAPKIYYENRLNEFTFEEKIKIVSLELEVDLVNNKKIPYSSLLLLEGFQIAPSEWYIFGTIKNKIYDFYDVLVKRTFLYENEFQSEILENLQYAPQSFIDKLKNQLDIYKNMDKDFFK